MEKVAVFDTQLGRRFENLFHKKILQNSFVLQMLKIYGYSGGFWGLEELGGN